MIIFDLDGTLADCEHRRHFVDITKNCNEKWKPDWEAFYQACDKDRVICPVLEMINYLLNHDVDLQIWSARCESVRDKTIKWLKDFLDIDQWFYRDCLKMRPIGDYTPDDQLKERWLDEALAKGKKIEMVFDDRPKVIRMWRRRGIFVFDCNQTGIEF